MKYIILAFLHFLNHKFTIYNSKWLYDQYGTSVDLIYKVKIKTFEETTIWGGGVMEGSIRLD